MDALADCLEREGVPLHKLFKVLTRGSATSGRPGTGGSGARPGNYPLGQQALRLSTAQQPHHAIVGTDPGLDCNIPMVLHASCCCINNIIFILFARLDHAGTSGGSGGGMMDEAGLRDLVVKMGLGFTLAPAGKDRGATAAQRTPGNSSSSSSSDGGGGSMPGSPSSSGGGGGFDEGRSGGNPLTRARSRQGAARGSGIGSTPLRDGVGDEMNLTSAMSRCADKPTCSFFLSNALTRVIS